MPADFNLLNDAKPPTLVNGDEELMRGVRLIHLPGHSPGSMALLVELDHAGSVLLTGDARAGRVGGAGRRCAGGGAGRQPGQRVCPCGTAVRRGYGAAAPVQPTAAAVG